ncbi:serine/threonine-protein kinase Nek3 isoform 1-T1 [Menidia menidia]
MERYSHLRVIGEGSFGRAVLVQSKITQEKLVIKQIQLPKIQSKLDNSLREAVLLSKMKHPHIVAFREAFEVDDLLCIVMEHCGGGDLLQRIQLQKNTQFGIENILKWFAQMCSGTQYIHDKKVLHRDMKSKNIFLTEDGSIKLGDFGSACILNSSTAYARAYVGTPYYVAPEIWENKPYNNKSDVWSLGCVLYELCTLRHPFQAPSWKSLVLKVCRGAYPPLPGRLPYELQHLVRQMFKTNPKDRPSVHTILTSHRASRLLRKHLSSQDIDNQKEGRRTCRWDREQGQKVATFLGEKSLIHTSTFEANAVPEGSAGPPESCPRKQWLKEPPDTVLQALAGASLQSDPGVSETSGDSRQRRKWERAPPERLLGLLEKAQLNRAFSTFLISRGDDDPLVGPLSQAQGDDPDGPDPEVEADESRLLPRSDDEDTDFEEESPCDWMDEVEKMFLKQ